MDDDIGQFYCLLDKLLLHSFNAAKNKIKDMKTLPFSIFGTGLFLGKSNIGSNYAVGAILQ